MRWKWFPARSDSVSEPRICFHRGILNDKASVLSLRSPLTRDMEALLSERVYGQEGSVRRGRPRTDALQQKSFRVSGQGLLFDGPDAPFHSAVSLAWSFTSVAASTASLISTGACQTSVLIRHVPVLSSRQ